MATILSHPAVPLAVAVALGSGVIPRRLLEFGVLCSILPDLDVIAFNFGIPYEAMMGHRGFTHSITFGVLWGALLAWLFFRKSPGLAWSLIALATVSHPLLDMCTNGGLGCALFAPFDNARLFFPWRPIKVAPIGVGAFFSAHGWAVLRSEMLWVWVPSAVLVLGARLLRSR